MGRRSSRPAARPAARRSPPRPAARPPARSASTQSRAPARAPAPAGKPAAPPAQKKAAPAPAPAQPAQQGSAMGGFMANVASTGLGVMAGRAMDRALFGGSGGGGEAAPEAYEAAPEAYEAAQGFEGGGEEMIEESVCAREAREFQKCMQMNGQSVAACQWNLDVLAACQRQGRDLGFADVGRM